MSQAATAVMTQPICSAPQSLLEMVSPASPEQFLSAYATKQFRHFPGEPGKFAGLLPWTALNQILQEHRLEPPRLQLVRDGQALPSASYLTFSPQKRPPYGTVPTIQPKEVNRLLREGATLVMDAVDELHQPIGDLCEDLEMNLGVRVQTNIYAGWRTSRGFELHWDKHDALILQVAGRKKWTVYPMTRPYPLANDCIPNVERPTEPIWEGTLSDGEMLFIPRGWWHVAEPLDEPTLHLTVGFQSVTAVDLLNWFVEQLRSEEIIRKDIPRLATAQEQADYVEEIRGVVAKAWSKDLFARYVESVDSRKTPRTRFSLPWTVQSETLPADAANCRLRWNAGRRVEIPETTQSGSTIAFTCNGRRFKFVPTAAPLLRYLTSRRSYTLAELCDLRSNMLPQKLIRDIVACLINEGLLVVVSAAQAGTPEHGSDNS